MNTVALDPAIINVSKAQPEWSLPTNESYWAYSGKVPDEALWWNSPSSYTLILAERLGATAYESKMAIDLPVPPESMVIQTPMAVSLSATMGGVVSEHNGAVFKDIEFSGSFGVLPFSLRQKNATLGSLGVGFPDLGNATANQIANSILNQTVNLNNPLLNQANQLVSLFQKVTKQAPVGPSDLSYYTGYGAWRWVTFFFENYAALRRQNKSAKYILILRVPKQERDYLVELVNYVTYQSKDSPYEYKYRITFKSFGSKNIDLVSGAIDSFDLFGMARDVSNIVASAGLFMSLSSDFIASTGRAIANATDIIKDVGLAMSSLMSIGTTVLNLPNTIVRGVLENWAVASQDTQSSVADFNSTVASLVNSFNQAINQGTPSSAQGAISLSEKEIKRALTSRSSRLPASLQKQLPIALSRASLTALTSNNPNLERSILENTRRVSSLSIQDWKSRQLTLKQAAIQVSQATQNNVSLVAETYQIPTTRNSTIRPSITSAALQQTLNANIQLVSAIVANQQQPSQSQSNFLRALARAFAAQGVALRSSNAKVLAPVLKNQTLEQMAAFYLGDANRWNEIAALNNLRAPYIDEDGVRLNLLSTPIGSNVFVSANTIVKVGEVVFLSSRTKRQSAFEVVAVTPRGANQQVTLAPIRSLANLGVVPQNEAVLSEFSTENGAVLQAFLENTTNSRESIFLPSDAAPTIPPTATASNFANILINDGNSDLALDSNGDLALDAGDFRLVDGVPNIQQQIRLILETPKGSILQHPEFGITPLQGQSTEDIDLNRVVSEIQSQIGADPSLGKLISISAQLSLGVVNIKASLYLESKNIVLPLSFAINVGA